MFETKSKEDIYQEFISTDRKVFLNKSEIDHLTSLLVEQVVKVNPKEIQLNLNLVKKLKKALYGNT